MTKLVPNLPSPQGRALGKELARLCDGEIAKLDEDRRCGTCAFRLGTYPNGCVATLIDALGCALKRQPFMCHESNRPCAGWLSIRSPKGEEIDDSQWWPLIGGADEPE